MFAGLGKLLGHNYFPLNRIEISKSALKNNFLFLSSINKNARIAPVLKSNAYGHGIGLIAKELDTYHLPFFCVDSLYEAYELLKIGTETSILVMGSFDPNSLRTKRLPFSFAVFTKEQLISINKYQPQAKIHVFVDTGMHREGVLVNELKDFLSFIKSETDLAVEGLMSHLAMSENPQDKNIQKQIKMFKEAQEITKFLKFAPKWIHWANSSGILNSNTYGDTLGNISRTGLALYGIDPAGKNDNLKPLLKLITHIVEIKEIPKNDFIGYNFAFKSKKKMKIAVLPLGYHDGVDRRLSNLGYVQINKRYCPIVGNVSMNITTIDVSDIKNAHLGQEVLVYSDNAADKNSIKNAAKLEKTIPYELLVHLDSSIKRILV